MPELAILDASQKTWQQAYRCANFLLNEGVAVSWATEPFTSVSGAGKKTDHARGSLLITESGSWRKAVRERFGLDAVDTAEVDGFAGLALRRLRIGHYGGGGAPMNHARIYAELGFLVDFIEPQEIRQGRLEEFDMLIIPGGGGLGMIGQLKPLGDEGCRKVTEFVQQGGMYVGACAGSFDGAIAPDVFLADCPEQKHMQLANAAIWNQGDAWLGLESPGVGVIESHNTAPEHPLMFGMPERFPITHYNGPIFEPQNGTISGASDMIAFASVAGATEDFTPSEYFLRWSEYDAEEAKGNTLLSRAVDERHSNIVGGYNGLGRVVLFGSHAEFGYNLAMDKWDAPARMLANAAFWQAGHLTESRPLGRKKTPGITHSYPLGGGLNKVLKRIPAIAAATDDLRDRDVSQAPWLSDDHAMSTFGLSGREIWAQSLENFKTVTDELEDTIAKAARAVRDAQALRGQLLEAGKSGIADEIEDALLALEEAVHYRAPAEWHHDFGYEGALQMLDRIEAMLARTNKNFSEAFDPTPNPYAHFEDSPFHLVVGSYLSAIGVYASCWFLLRVHFLRLDELVYRGRKAL